MVYCLSANAGNPDFKPMKKLLNILFLMVFSAPLLAGCTNTKRDLGLIPESPDEFAVVRRAPLAMPPDYSLRPPAPGMPRPMDQVTGDEARAAVFGDKGKGSPGKISKGDDALLQATGANQVDPAIRQRVDRETASTPPKQQPVVKKLFKWTSDEPEEPAATVVDPAAELARMKNNQQSGKPVTAGDTPSKEE
jgi:hypothetical protein